jgi:hypothetical protein
MAGVPKMQEQLFGQPPWMAGVPKMQEQIFGHARCAFHARGKHAKIAALNDLPEPFGRHAGFRRHDDDGSLEVP